jgi:hypothetical protein
MPTIRRLQCLPSGTSLDLVVVGFRSRSGTFEYNDFQPGKKSFRDQSIHLLCAGTLPCDAYPFQLFIALPSAVNTCQEFWFLCSVYLCLRRSILKLQLYLSSIKSIRSCMPYCGKSAVRCNRLRLKLIVFWISLLTAHARKWINCISGSSSTTSSLRRTL